MKSSDMELFGSALSEAVEKRLVDELSACRESDRCSSWHKKRMRRIVKGKTVEPRTRAENIDKYLLYRYNWRRFAWYLVAAVILLVMVTRVWEPQPLLTPEPWSSFLKNCERMLPLLLLIPISFLLSNDYEIELGLVCGVRNAKLMLAKFVPIVCYTLLGMATVILLYRYIPFDEMNLTNFQEVIEMHISPEMARLQKAVMGSGGDLTKVNGDSIFPVLDMLNMKYVIMKTNDGNKVPVFNPHAMGNAWSVSSIHWVDNADDELAAIGKDDLRRVAVVDRKFQDMLGSVPADADSCRVSVKLTSYEANRLAYEIDSEKGGVLVFSDIYYPGWTATVSGEEVPVARANYILRAIQVPAGKHEVVMTFDPQTVHTTEAIAYGALALLGLIIVGKIITLILKKRKCQK